MSQPLAEAARSKRLSVHAMATSALAVLAVAGGVALSGGEAQAQTVCATFPPYMPVTNPCTDGRFTLTPISGPTYPGAPVGALLSDVELHDLNNPAEPATVDIDIDFMPDLGDPDTGAPNTGTFDYQLTSSSSFVQLARLDANCPLMGCTVEKQLFSDSLFTMPIMLTNGTNVLISVDGAPAQSQIIGNYSSLYVRDIYSVNATGRLDNLTNTFQTPGPLPVLGAGAAFGFSRKLRGRIQLSRQA